MRGSKWSLFAGIVAAACSKEAPLDDISPSAEGSRSDSASNATLPLRLSIACEDAVLGNRVEDAFRDALRSVDPVESVPSGRAHLDIRIVIATDPSSSVESDVVAVSTCVSWYYVEEPISPELAKASELLMHDVRICTAKEAPAVVHAVAAEIEERFVLGTFSSDYFKRLGLAEIDVVDPDAIKDRGR